MTNPDNIVRVRARNGGRASVYEANGWAQAYSMGLLEGNGVTQNTSADMNVLVGGSTTKPDVVIAENPAGYKIALDLVTQQAVAITAPASNSRVSAIVAYTDDLSLQSTETNVTGSPASCGLIVVNGTTAATPSVPDDSQIRSAITADGATGSQASYCIVATVTVAAETTIITNSQITNNNATLSSSKIDFATTITGITYPNTNTIRSTNYPLTAKKIGKMVFLTGAIQLTGYSSAAATLASDISNAAVLPQGVRPAMRQILYAQSNGNVPIRVIINTDGNIGLGRYKPYHDYTGFAQVAQNAGVNFTCAYVVE